MTEGKLARPRAPFPLGPAPIFLAPMEGVVDWAMRDVLTRIGGVDLCVTEFIRVTDRLLPDHEIIKSFPELNAGARTRAGTPIMAQFLGGKPGPMAENAARAAELGAPGIDLNFGCPAKTVNRHDGGAALLKEPSRVRDVVGAVRRATPSDLPVSAKVRLGFSDKSCFLEIAQAAQDGGAEWLTVHARTRDEGYRPPAHWDYIGLIREALDIPVIANGDVWTLEDYRKCREVTGCSAVMMGRGLIASPDLALQAKSWAAGASRQVSLLWPDALAVLIDFTELSAFSRASTGQEKAARYALCRCKQWLKQLGRRYPEAGELFEAIKRQESCEDLLQALRLERSLRAPNGAEFPREAAAEPAFHSFQSEFVYG